MVPLELKYLNVVKIFKSEIRKWEPRQCKCTLCLPYVHGIGLSISLTINFTIILKRVKGVNSLLYIYDFVKPGS